MNKSVNKTLLISALMLELGMSAQAATIEVDAVNCHLGDAMTAANNDVAVSGCDAGSGADELVLPPDALMILTEALPDITTEMTIQGNGSTLQRDVNEDSFRILTIAGGSLNLNDSVISHGDTSYELNGPGPYNTGGGIHVNQGTLNMSRSTVTSNIGGGVMFVNANGLIVDSVISYNIGLLTFDVYGGAGVSIRCSDVTIDRSTIHHNTAKAKSLDPLHKIGGGGLLLTGDCTQKTNIINSTISSNQARDAAGGIFVQSEGGRLSLSQTTITQNKCNVYPGGGSGYRFCGIQSGFTGIVEINQSLIVGNIDLRDPKRDDADVSIFWDIVDSYSVINNSPEAPLNIPAEDILDLSLSYNGGLTPTHALKLDGVAVDVIPEPLCFSSNDQTNNTRPIDATDSGEAKCDAGAVEAKPDLIFANDFDSPVP